MLSNLDQKTKSSSAQNEPFEIGENSRQLSQGVKQDEIHSENETNTLSKRTYRDFLADNISEELSEEIKTTKEYDQPRD